MWFNEEMQGFLLKLQATDVRTVPFGNITVVQATSKPTTPWLNFFVVVVKIPVAYLACVNGIMVGGFGGCCGTMRPRRVGPRCGNDISPAERSDMMPVPLLSSLLEFDVKHTRPPCNRKRNETLWLILEIEKWIIHHGNIITRFKNYWIVLYSANIWIFVP